MGWGGGGGGGALLIAAASTLSITGQIRANGGQGVNSEFVGWRGSCGGAGGAVRIVAESLAGTGNIAAMGGLSGDTAAAVGGLGRIRIERVMNTGSISVTPDPSVVDLSAGATALIWPPNGAPQVRIVSVEGRNAPTDPRAAFGTAGADVALPALGSVQVVVETTDVEQASQVLVRGTPRSNGRYNEVGAGLPSLVSTNPLVIRWTANLPVQVGYSAVQVQVIRP